MALVALLCVSLIQAEEPPIEPALSDAEGRVPGAQHPVAARILTRVLDDGRVELCLLTERLEVLCPRLRIFHPDQVRKNRWIVSSEVTWSIPVEPTRIVRTPSLAPAEREELVEQVDNGSEEAGGLGPPVCDPNFEEMLASTWKVHTTKWLGSAFYIGNGRFITAHHVIDGVPPFVTLTHGERAIPAAVLGSDPSVDMALLGVFAPELVADLPVAGLRVPERDDIGSDVYLVGYPGGGPLTVSFGGIVSRVWEDEIQTTSASAGGNSGGPMFDQCGNVIGVLWAGSSSSNFSHSGEVLSRKLGELQPVWPRLPAEVPEALASISEFLLWHYGTEPPDDVDCSRVDADIWIGMAGGDLEFWEFGERYGLAFLGACNWNETKVGGFLEPTPSSVESTEEESDSDADWPGSCYAGSLVKGKHIGNILHQSVEEFGTATFTTLNLTTDCPLKFNYQLRIDFNPPLAWPWGSQQTLIDINGVRLEGPWQGGSYETTGPGAESPTKTQFQAWAIPNDFVPVAFEITLGDQGKRTIDFVSPEPEGPSVTQSLRLAAFVDSASGTVSVCPQSLDRTLLCAALTEISIVNMGNTHWRVTEPFEWTTPVDALSPEEWGLTRTTPLQENCALNQGIGLTSWQANSVGNAGTAVYVGNGQFLVHASIVSEELPWVVVSQGDRAHPAIRIATDARNGLALVETMGDAASDEFGRPLRFGAVTEASEGASLWLVSYPYGHPDRFHAAIGVVEDITDRTFRFPTWGSWFRQGAPAIEPCTHEALGISLGGGRILRADAVAESLKKLRRNRQAPRLPETGPLFRGPVALWPHPVYVGTEQPDFGGWICNVRESERYDIYYAVYMSRSDDFQLRQIVDGEDSWVRTCGWPDKVFIVEYRSDHVPELICGAPIRPNHPLSDMTVDFIAPEGVELLQIANFKREPCGDVGYEDPRQDGWSSDFYLSIRVTQNIDLDHIFVEYGNAEGEMLNVVSHGYWDVDPDVISWRVNVIGDQPVAKVTVRLLEPRE